MKAIPFVRSFIQRSWVGLGGASASALGSPKCYRGNPVRDSISGGGGPVAAFLGWIERRINVRNLFQLGFPSFAGKEGPTLSSQRIAGPQRGALLALLALISNLAFAAAPDLMLTSSVGASPNPVVAGNGLSVSYTVKNQGTGGAAQSQTRVQVKLGSSTTTTTEIFHTTPALGAGISTSETVSVPISSSVAAGAYTIYVILDYNNAIGQSNVNNDTYQTAVGAVTIQAAAAAAPDLMLTSSVGASPNPVVAGNGLSVSYTVKNQGTGGAAQSQTRVQVKLGSSTTTTTEIFHTTPALGAGISTSETVSVPISSSVAAGAYTIYVILDYNNAIGQSNVNNDTYQTAVGAVTIQAAAAAAPDLMLTSSVGASPNPVVAGNSLSVSYTVKNQGTGGAAQSQTRVQVKLGSSTTTTTEIFHTTPALGAGISTSETVSVPISSSVAAERSRRSLARARYSPRNFRR